MFNKISQTAFEEMQIEAGILLLNFDPANPVEPADADIICATTGGITVNCQPSFSDWAEDVDNAKDGMMEFKHLDGWDCNIQVTALGTDPALIKLALGCADIDSNDATKIKPRWNVKLTDFNDSIWFVGEKANGGLVVCQLLHALSTGGFSLKTTKNGKGQISLTISGHPSVNDQDTVPMQFWSTPGTEEEEGGKTEGGKTEGGETEGGGNG